MSTDVQFQAGTHPEIRRIAIEIFNLGCAGGGTLIIERVLLRLPGVRNAYVNAATEMAYVEYDASRCSAEQIQAAIQRAGFKVGAPNFR
jgi:Cu+-exporting ATPase